MTAIASHKVTWEKLPDDFVLPRDPVDNINQPLLAAALRESLELAGRLSPQALVTTNYGICARINNHFVIKAPDWSYIPRICVPHQEVERSYTPQLQGESPAIVMEFLSETEGDEYSIKPTYPPGKWFFYEQILKVPSYVIFEPKSGLLEVYRLDNSGRYQLQAADETDRYWLAELNLYLGRWQGNRDQRTGYWLRWWDQQGNLLLWGAELAEQERQRTEQERRRADRLADRLRAAGINPDDLLNG